MHYLLAFVLLLVSLPFKTAQAQALAPLDSINQRLLEQAVSEALHNLNSDDIRVAAFSQDRSRLLIANRENIKIFNPLTGEELYHWPGVEGSVSAAVFDPQGHWVYLATLENTIYQFDLDSGQRGKSFSIARYLPILESLTITPDGRLLMSGHLEGMLVLWDIQEEHPPRPVHAHESAVRGIFSTSVSALTFSADGRYALSGDSKGTLIHWDLKTGRPSANHRALERSIYGIQAALFLPDNTTAITASSDNVIRLWDLNTGRFRVLSGHQHTVTHLALSSDARQLASADEQGTLMIWNLENDRVLARYQPPERELIRALAFSPEGDALMHVNHRGKLGRHALNFSHPEGYWIGHSKIIQDTRISQDGTRALSRDWDGVVKLWDTEQGTELLTLGLHGIRSFSLSDDGRLGLFQMSGDEYFYLELWDLEKGQRLQRLHPQSENDRIERPLFLHGQTETFITSNIRVGVQLRDMETGAVLETYVEGGTELTSPVYNVSRSGDGQSILILGDNRLEIRKLPSGQLMSTPFPSHELPDYQFARSDLELAALSANGQQIFFHSPNLNRGQLAELQLGDEPRIQVYPTCGPRLKQMAMTADDRHLVVATSKKLCFMDARTGETLATFDIPGGDLTSLAISRTENKMLVANRRALTLWDPSEQSLIRILSDPDNLWSPE